MTRKNKLKQNLNKHKKILLGKFNNNQVAKIIDDIIELYDKIDCVVMDLCYNEYHRSFYTSIIAMDKVLQNQKLSQKDREAIIYRYLFKMTEESLIDFSLIQMAYYIMCEKIYIIEMILCSFTGSERNTLDDLTSERNVEEDIQYEVLLKESPKVFYNMDFTFTKQLDELFNDIIKDFTEIHFKKYGSQLTMLDLI